MGKPGHPFDELGRRLAAAGEDRRERDWPSHVVRPHGPVDRRVGAVLVATLFHLVGTRNLAEDGLVHRPLDWIAYAVLMIGPVALFWRRRAPIPVFAVAAAASLVVSTWVAPHLVYAAAPAMALFSIANLRGWRPAAIAAGTGFAAYLVVALVLGLQAGPPPGPGKLALAAAGLAGAVLFGAGSRVHHDNLAEIKKARAEQARATEEQERRQASEERLRIAQELHDVLGHHLSLINVQAGVGLHLMDNRPEQAREALTAIKSASAEALREVRSVLSVLRTEGEAAPRQPALGLNRLDELTADAGIPVRTVINGQPRQLPAEVDRAAYRIVQEALTNVRRHAGSGPEAGAQVTVGYLTAALHLSIRNGGVPPDAAVPSGGGGGSGIAGMRARVETLGGKFAAGRLPAGGFLVSVVLPTPPGRDGPAPPGRDGPAPPGRQAQGADAPVPGCGMIAEGER